MRAVWLSLVIVLGACNSPPFALRFRLTQGDTYRCPSDQGGVATDCADVTMLCDAVLSIRIVPPSAPTLPYITLCKQLTRKDVCGIAGIDLPPPTVPVPEQRLLVEMVLYPKARLTKDDNGDYVCPPATFADNGFPIALQEQCDSHVTDPSDPQFCIPQPAIGGSAYYNPGDSETVVELGCTDLEQLQDPRVCVGANAFAVTATVNDFDTEVSVAPTLGDRLNVSIGEPKPIGAEYELNPSDATQLTRALIQPIPSWTGDVATAFTNVACLEVLEDGPQATTALTCKPLVDATAKVIDITGVRLAKPTLDDVLFATGDPFPAPGLVVGIVLDTNGAPAPGYVVSTSSPSATIDYLSSNRRALTTGGTTDSGMFLSSDAPFGTMFTTGNTTLKLSASAVGGLVVGKVTIVVLQLAKPPVNP